MKFKIKSYLIVKVFLLILLSDGTSLFSQSKKELCRMCNDASVLKSNYFDSMIVSALEHNQTGVWLNCNSIYGGSGRLLVHFGGNARYKELDRKGHAVLEMSIEDKCKMEIPQDEYLICYKIFERSGKLIEMYTESDLGFRTGKAIKFITPAQSGAFYQKEVKDYEIGYEVGHLKVIKICKKKGIDFSRKQLGVNRKIYKTDFNRKEMLRQNDSFSNWIVNVMKDREDMKVWWVSIDNFKYLWLEYHLLIDAKSGVIIGEKYFQMQAGPVSYGHPSPNLKSFGQLLEIAQKELQKDVCLLDPRFKDSAGRPVLPYRDSFDDKVRYIGFSQWHQFEYDSLQKLRRIVHFKINDSTVEINSEEFVVDGFFKIYRVYKDGKLKSLRLNFYLGFDVLSYQKKDEFWVQETDTSGFGYEKLIKLCDTMKLWPNVNDRLSKLEVLKLNNSTNSIDYDIGFPKLKERSFWLITRREWNNGRDMVLIIDSKTGQVLKTFFVRLN